MFTFLRLPFSGKSRFFSVSVSLSKTPRVENSHPKIPGSPFPLKWFENELNELPKLYRRPTSNFKIKYAFVKDLHIAGEICARIASKLHTCEIEFGIEVNPGFGLLSSGLENLFPKLIIYDTLQSKAFKKIVMTKESSKIEVIEKNLFFCDDNITYRDFLKAMDAIGDKRIAFVGVNPSRVFIRRIIQNIVYGNMNFCKNVIFFFAISDQIYRSFVKTDFVYSKFSDICLFSMLFHCEIICKIPRDKVVPPSLLREKHMQLILLKRKKKIELADADLVLYWHFLQFIGKSKYTPVIPVLENWFRGIGPYLIGHGLAMTNTIIDLQPEELLKLFKLLLKNKEQSHVLNLLCSKAFEFSFSEEF